MLSIKLFAASSMTALAHKSRLLEDSAAITSVTSDYRPLFRGFELQGEQELGQTSHINITDFRRPYQQYDMWM